MLVRLCPTKPYSVDGQWLQEGLQLRRRVGWQRTSSVQRGRLVVCHIRLLLLLLGQRVVRQKLLLQLLEQLGKMLLLLLLLGQRMVWQSLLQQLVLGQLGWFLLGLLMRLLRWRGRQLCRHRRLRHPSIIICHKVGSGSAGCNSCHHRRCHILHIPALDPASYVQSHKLSEPLVRLGKLASQVFR